MADMINKTAAKYADIAAKHGVNAFHAYHSVCDLPEEKVKKAIDSYEIAMKDNDHVKGQSALMSIFNEEKEI